MQISSLILLSRRSLFSVARSNKIGSQNGLHIFLVLVLMLHCPVALAHKARWSSPEPQTIQAQENIEILSLGKEVRKDIGGGKVHSYTIDLESQHFIQVVVTAKEIDLAIILQRPDGLTVRQLTTSNPRGEAIVNWVAENAGKYRLEVRAIEINQKPARYLAKIETLRSATPQDRSLIDGENVFDEGLKLLAQGTPNVLSAAYNKFEEARVFFQTAKDVDHQGQTLRRQAYVYLIRREPQKALSLGEEVVRLLRQAYGPNDLRVAQATWELGDLLMRAGRVPEGSQKFEKALKLVEDAVGIETLAGAMALQYQASGLMALSKTEEALTASQRAIGIFEQRYGADSVQAANAYISFANILQSQLRHNHAYEFLERALKNYETRFSPDGPENLNLLFQVIHTLRRLDRRDEALKKTEQALRIITQRFGLNSQQATSTMNLKGEILSSLERHSEARKVYQQVFEISAPESPSASQALLSLAQSFVSERDYQQARLKFDDLIKFIEKYYGPKTHEMAVTLRAKLDAYPALADYAAGRELYEKALQISKPLGDEELTATLIVAGEFDLEHQKKEDGIAKYERAAKIWEDKGDPYLVRAAALLYELGRKLSQRDNDREATNVLQRVAEMYEKIYGPKHVALIGPLNALSMALMVQSRFEEAEQRLQRSLKILDGNHQEPIFAETIARLASTLALRGKFQAAAQAYWQALKIFERRGSDRLFDDDELGVRIGLVESLVALGEFPKARKVLEEIISKKYPGQPPLALSIAHIYMALILMAQKDKERALPYLDKIKENPPALADAEDSVVVVYFNLATAAFMLAGRDADAREFARKTSARAEGVFEVESLMPSRLLITQTMMLMDLGDYTGAEEIVGKLEKHFAESLPDHYLRSVPLIVRGESLVNQGKKAQGLVVLEDAVKILEESQGPKNYMTAEGYNRLGWLNHSQKKLPQTREWFYKASGAIDNHLTNVLPMLSLAEQRVFLDETVANQISSLFTVCREPADLKRAYELIFRWKGSLLDSLRRQAVITRLGREDNAKDIGPEAAQRREQIKRLIDAHTSLAAWYRQFDSAKAEEWKKKNDELTLNKEKLERSIAPEVKAELDDPLVGSLQAFQRQLREDEVFIDLYQYDYHTPGDKVVESYAAVMTGPARDPVFVDLGSREKINHAIQNWRDKVLAARVDPAKQWRALATLLWQPLVDVLPSGARKVWVSPDGELARIPWQLLPKSSLKTTNVFVALADSPRELSRLRQTRIARTTEPAGILLVGGVDFDTKLTASAARVEGRGLGSLAETLGEIGRIADIWRESNGRNISLTGSMATKNDVVANLQKVKYAHLATHGFFTPAAKELVPKEQKVRWAPLFDGAVPPKSRNPLVESGIALAGANTFDQVTLESIGLLTAEEIIGLDLSHCELVTLSACETGRGEEVTGQGVMGLRASIMTAGSRSMLMSLWKVPTNATVKFMEAFYSNLWQKKMTKAEALLRAQDTVRESGFSHPYYWSAWVLVGEAW